MGSTYGIDRWWFLIGLGKKVRARGGALNFNSNGLDVNNYNDDDSYNNVSASRALPFPNFCLPFLLASSSGDEDRILFLLGAFNPAANHAPDLIELFLEWQDFLLWNSFYINR